MKPARSMYISEIELRDAREAYEQGKTAAMLNADRDQKPDRYGEEWYWGYDEIKAI